MSNEELQTQEIIDAIKDLVNELGHRIVKAEALATTLTNQVETLNAQVSGVDFEVIKAKADKWDSVAALFKSEA